jgi:hypothetical protein
MAISGGAVMPAKKKVKKKVPHRMVTEHKQIDINYQTLSDLIPRLQGYMDEYGPSAMIEIFEEYDCCVCRLEWKRPENAKEKKRRLDDVKQQKNWRRQQYESLKKEFGDS